jgi:hypothetical protein
MEEHNSFETSLPNNTALYLQKLYSSSITLLKNAGQFNPVLNFQSCFFKIRFHTVRAVIRSHTFKLRFSNIKQERTKNFK